MDSPQVSIGYCYQHRTAYVTYVGELQEAVDASASTTIIPQDSYVDFCAVPATAFWDISEMMRMLQSVSLCICKVHLHYKLSGG